MRKNGAVEKLTDNPYLNLYHIDAVDTKGVPFDYYFASRNQEERLKMFTRSLEPEGIVVYALTREMSPRLVVIKEYRYPLDAEVYALPAGLVDPGETPGMAAVREMKEETGYHFTEYTGGSPSFRRPFYMGPGFTDETSCAVYGTVEVSVTETSSACESTEQIRTILADKEQVRKILSNERVSLRCAYLMMQYLQMEDAAPFAFLA